MKDGDLSNELAPTIGIRFERVLKTEEGKLNRAARAYLQSISRLDVNIIVITTGDRRKALAFLTKWNIPYAYLIGVESNLEIPDILAAHGALSYYDLEERVLQNVRSRGPSFIEAKTFDVVEVA